MKPFIYQFKGLKAEDVFTGLADARYSLFFDSADRAHPGARYSYIAIQPDEIIETRNLKDLQARLDFHGAEKEFLKDLPPFQGGAAGMITYEGDIRFGIYTQVMAFDHAQDKAWLIIHETSQEKANAKRDFFMSGEITRSQDAPVEFFAQTEEEDYKKKIQTVIDYIRAGDIFQANLSQKFTADLPENFDSYTHYLNLRAMNPAPYAAFMNFGDVQIASASPESFLSVQDGVAQTRPIKGTRPRHENQQDDATSRSILENSSKDRAENIMIVDLLRNDLSKVCTPGSIEVTALCKPESFASVHHLVSTVQGKLAAKKTALDALQACFPGGSITGAPKIRATEILKALEGEPRGPYCGSAGFIGFDGMMQTNILIRTLVYSGDHVSFRTGGGITAQSNPEGEFQETMDKAERILSSFAKPLQRQSA